MEKPERAERAVAGYSEMTWIPGGTFRMGFDRHYPEEATVHRVTLGGFSMDRTPVSGQATLRTGLMRVGVPAAPVALQARDPTIAESSKPLGYATGQFGKNQLVDRNEFLPTVHGFDDFFGNLYHLNAEGNRKASTIRSTPASVNGLVRGVLMRRTADTDWPLSRWRSSISRPATDPPLRYSSTAP